MRPAALLLALLAVEVIGGGHTHAVFFYLLGVGGLYSVAGLWLAFGPRGSGLPWALYIGLDLALLSALLYTSGGGDSPVRALFILAPLVGVLSYSVSWTAAVGGVAALDYLLVAGIHSAAEGGPSIGSLLVFSLFILLGTLGATLPVQAVVARGRAQAELEQRARLLRERAARTEAEAVAEMVGNLQRITDVTLTHLSLEELLSEVLRRIVDVVRCRAATILLAEDDLTLRVASTAGSSRPQAGARLRTGEGLPGRVAGGRRALASAADAEDDAVSRGLADDGAMSLFGVPLNVDDHLIGVLVVGTRNELRSVEGDLLRLAADRIALSIQRAQLYEREHLVAQTLQRSLLPERLPQIPGVAVAARYLPARDEARVGGDWYDVLDLPGGAVGLAMGDVVSHGIRAASVMGQLRSSLRAYAFDGESPATALTKLNTVVRGLDRRESVTAVYLALDLEERTLSFASAGHPPPLVIDLAGRARFLEGGRSVPLGADTATRYREAVARLDPGSTLVLYTDGLIERRGASLDEGLRRLASAAGVDGAEPESLCEQLVDVLVGDEPPLDDVALMAVHVLPVSGERLELELPCRASTLAPLRRMVRQWLVGARASRAELQDLLVAVSEAATNAVEHAYRPGEGSYRVEGRLIGDRVVLTVRDSGSWRERRDGERGRGTKLMRQLVDGFELRSSTDGTVVRLERRLGSRAAA